MSEYWDRMSATDFFTGYFSQKRYDQLLRDRAEHKAREAERDAHDRGGIPTQNFWPNARRPGSEEASA